MHLPYIERWQDAAAFTAQSVGGALTAIVWHRPLRTRTANVLFGASIWLAALSPVLPDITRLLHLGFDFKVPVVLQASAMLATLAILLHGLRWLGVVAVLGQFVLYALGEYLRDSNFELMNLYLTWYGVLLGAHAAVAAPPRRDDDAAVSDGGEKRSYARHDVGIFLAVTALAALVANVVYERVLYNGDEIAYTYMADLFGHFRAYGPIPPCPSMFENYWVFRYHGHSFSQYTPGWPLFMAAFSRAGVVWLAGPVMAGLLAIAVARLSRRAAGGLGATALASHRTVTIAGILGAGLAFLGPALLMNGASRFSHTMVCACFAWSVESLCTICDRVAAHRSARGWGFLFGAALALGLSTRPIDAGALGVGVFLYFLWALWRRRLAWAPLLMAGVAFACFLGLTLTILRLQLGSWFNSGYQIAPSIHPESALRLSWPHPEDWKYGFPLGFGSYCWWPVAPALGAAGLLHSLRGRERRVAFMLVVSVLPLMMFYSLVDFSRGHDDGMGPRYTLPVVIPMAVGGAVILAPLVTRAWQRVVGWRTRINTLGPAVLVALAVAYGVARDGALMYPEAHRQFVTWAAPLLGARKMGLKNAIVIIEPGHVPHHETNMAQNSPTDPNPPVLFLIHRSPSDDVCAREHFPGRTWYRAGMDTRLTPY
jgi:hypothetical protein